MAKRIRAVAACLVLGALTNPGAAASSATPDPGSSAAPSPAAVPTLPGSADVAPRAGLPELLPDPNPRPSPAPGGGGVPEHGMPPRPGSSGRPTPEDRDALLARVSPYGIVPVVDTAGAPALTVDHELVLTGGPQGVDAMRAAGIDVVPGPRPGVSVVRSDGRTVAWYVVDDPAAPPGPPGPPMLPALPVPVPDATAAPPSWGLPKTGPGATIALVAAGLLLVLGGSAAVRFTARRRRTRS